MPTTDTEPIGAGTPAGTAPPVAVAEPPVASPEPLAPPPRTSANVKVPGLAIYIAAFVLGLALQRMLPLPSMRGTLTTGIGVALLAVGMVFIVWTLLMFLVKWVSPASFLPTNKLILTGPFRWSRHPLYTAGLGAYLGGALWGGWLWVLLCAVPLAWVIRWYAIAREERYLEEKFGDEYRSYEARVRRWI